MEHCAICLLNLGEWEYLTGLEKRWNYFEIAAAVAYACLDIAKYKGNKKVSRDAWDIGRKRECIIMIIVFRSTARNFHCNFCFV
jgi:uncharacterized ferredoxin-like protein